jgi:hypothetical protein
MFIEIKQPLFDAIQQILMTEWDPIGVQGEPDAADEYHNCAGRVYAYLAQGLNAERIATYLAQVETDEMAMPPRDAAELQRCAEHLVQCWEELDHQK